MPRVKKSTNVLETIRKAPLAENKTALKKNKKIRFVELPITDIL